MKGKSGKATATCQTVSSLRRMPNQRRSKQRVENILQCAILLIAKNGSDAMRMSELAQKAGVSIGSLYQYFPGKAAIIQTLAGRYNAQGRDCIKAALDPVSSVEELQTAFAALIDEYYEIFLADPAICDIWSGTQADKALHDIELKASRENAEILANALNRLTDKADKEILNATAFLIMHLGEATMRLALPLTRAEGRKLVDAYKRMALAELCRIVGAKACIKQEI